MSLLNNKIGAIIQINLLIERRKMKKKNNKPNLTQPILDIHKMLQAIYRKGYLAGKRDALKK